VTFVLDFVNERETILESFQDYYETTTTEDAIDPQRLYELQHELDECQIYTPSEVDGLAAVFYKLDNHNHKRLADNARLNAWIDPAVDRFKALKADAQDEAGEERQEHFRGKLVAFQNLYGFLGQIIPFSDPDLEKRYTFVRMLRRKLPRPDGAGPLDLGDALVTRHEKHADFINSLFADEALGDLFRGLMLDQVYGQLRGASGDQDGSPGM
jgi:type I restriction enzyme R subunit